MSSEPRSTGARDPWGVVRCTPDDTRVIEKRVCYSLRNAELAGRVMKKKHPADTVRLIPLAPGVMRERGATTL